MGIESTTYHVTAILYTSAPQLSSNSKKNNNNNKRTITQHKNYTFRKVNNCIKLITVGRLENRPRPPLKGHNKKPPKRRVWLSVRLCQSIRQAWSAEWYAASNLWPRPILIRPAPLRCTPLCALLSSVYSGMSPRVRRYSFIGMMWEYHIFI